MDIPRLTMTVPSDRTATLRAKAKDLEAAFLAEMLAHAGLDGSSSDFGGGIGEEQFTSFLREAQARAMVDSGGIGLAEQIFHALSEGRS